MAGPAGGALGLRRWGGRAGPPAGGAPPPPPRPGEVLAGDLRALGAASLPPGGLAALPAGARVGRCLLQVEEAVDVARPAAGRFGPAAAGGGRRCLKLLLCDGEAECVALEAAPCPAIPAAPPPGSKLLVEGALVRGGAILLEPGTFVWLGGQVPAFVACANRAAAAWKSAVSWKNFRPRGTAPSLEDLGRLARDAFEAAAAEARAGGVPGARVAVPGGPAVPEGAEAIRAGTEGAPLEQGGGSGPLSAGAPGASPPPGTPSAGSPPRRSSQRLRRLKRAREEGAVDDPSHGLVVVPESPDAAGDPIESSLPPPPAGPANPPSAAGRGGREEAPAAATTSFLADELLLPAAAETRRFQVRASIVSVCRVSSVNDAPPTRVRPAWDAAVVVEDGTASVAVTLHPVLAESVMGMSTEAHSRLSEGEQLAHLARLNQRLTSWVGLAEVEVSPAPRGGAGPPHAMTMVSVDPLITRATV